jgi:hypothetical protein
LVENTNPGDYVTDMDEQLLQMIIQSSAAEARLMNMNSLSDEEEQRLMEQAIQESVKENPNPDVMSYEQLSELGDQIGTVSKGYSEYKLSKLRPRANFDHIED